MKGLDWLVYLLALLVVLWALFSSGSPGEYAPPPPPDVFEQDGPLLPEPSSLDNRILIQVEEPPAREAGIKVGSVAELVDKLRNEAKVLGGAE